MASVRKRTWKAATGELKAAWVVDYADSRSDRQRKHFPHKKAACARHLSGLGRDECCARNKGDRPTRRGLRKDCATVERRYAGTDRSRQRGFEAYAHLRGVHGSEGGRAMGCALARCRL